LASLRKEEPCILSSTAQPTVILLLDSNSLASMWLMALGMAQSGICRHKSAALSLGTFDCPALNLQPIGGA
jgi:hypothetical protein